MRTPALALLAALVTSSVTLRASAQDATVDATVDAPVPASPPELAPDAQVQIATTPPEGQTGQLDTTLPTPPPEAPPMRPRHKGFVLESTLGVLGFAGKFAHVAPSAPWLHTTFGYEVLPWLMVLAEGELAYTDTSESQDASHVKAFPIYGFGGGARVTIHATDRVAFFGQGDLGALTAYVPHHTLGLLGFRDAESLNPQFGGRLGAEWYQLDRHMALSAQGGLRDAQGFGKLAAGGGGGGAGGGGDTPLMWDAAVGLRYTF